MSEPILPLLQWPQGVDQPSVSFNDNALRLEALSRPALGVENDEAGGEADGTVYIVGDTPTGAFANFETDDIALRWEDSWYAWAPVEGLRMVVDDVRMVYLGSGGWDNDPSITGGGGGGMSNPMTTAGDLIVGGASGAPQRLAVGTEGQIVKVVSGAPAYADPSTGDGDVVGPASATADRIAVFDGATGKQIKDGGRTIASLRAPSIQSVVSASTVTPTFSDDMVIVTAQAAALTLANPTGTAIPGLGMVIRIKDNGTARAITYGSQYRAIGVTLPTTTVVGKTTYLAMIYNGTDTTWDVLAVGQQA